MKTGGLFAWLAANRPLCVGVAFFVFVVGSLFVQMCRANGGPFAYPLDDPYIHLAMAKNLARHGVLGVTSEAFSASTSSPLWTLILGLTFLLTGVHELTPLWINLALGIAVLVVVDRVLPTKAEAVWRVFVLVAVVLFTPMTALVLSGMEHVLQLLSTLLFLEAATCWLAAEEPRPPPVLFALGAILTGVRYEGAFLVASVCVLSLVRNRRRAAAWLALVGASPIVSFGLLSLSHGSMFLPNSVLLKGGFPNFDSLEGALHALGYAAVEQLVNAPHLSGLVAVALVVYAARSRHHAFWEPVQVSMLLLFMTTILHMQFASTGWFFRYEAYLMAWSIVTLATAACDISGSLPKLALALAALIGLAPAAWKRAQESLVQLPQAANNVYEQQVQMGRFVARYYRGARVAANDVGAIDFFGDIRLLDLVGLASVDVMRLERAGRYDTAQLSRIAREREVDIAIAYADSRITIPLPSDWVPVGRWTIPHNLICASDTVTFFAVRASVAHELAAHLREFATSLPAEVSQVVTLR